MLNFPSRAMVLAAGFGTRLRPLTLDRPKALVEVAGRSLIDRTLDQLAQAGILTAVVNIHYKGNLLRRALANRQRPQVIVSDETDAVLDTGGGIVKALPLLGDGPFFAVNCDIIWRDAQEESLHRLAARWDDDSMDALLLMQPTVTAIGYDGMGDFNVDPLGRLSRRDCREVAPHLFCGIQLLHPRLFEGAPAGAFSMNLLYDRAIEAGRLYGLVHEGDWMDVGTLAGLAAAEAYLTPRRRK